MENNYPEIPEYIRELLESGEIIDEIRLDGEGSWFHNNEKFTNNRIIDFFNRSIDITREGQYVIHYSHFVYPIIVEDVPVFITGARFHGSGKSEHVYISLSTGAEEILEPESLFYKDNCLYCYVMEGRLPAKFKRSPSYHIMERLQESDDIYFLEIGGKKIVLKEKQD